jgi:hypothetical protein
MLKDRMVRATSGSRRQRRSTDECVLLVHPGTNARDNLSLFPPRGALYIADALRSAGVSADVLDLNGAPIAERIESVIAKLAPTVVGITSKLDLAHNGCAK